VSGVDNPHFQSATSLAAARALLTFQPREPRYTAGRRLESIHVHVRDHKLRELAIAERSLETHYGAFVVTQACKGAAEARRWALEVSYGRDGQDARIAGCAARVYELGPEVPPNDIDGRSPAVVTWHDGDMHYLVASDEFGAAELVRIAGSLYG